jgi:hypothetical protein
MTRGDVLRYAIAFALRRAWLSTLRKQAQSRNTCSSSLIFSAFSHLVSQNDKVIKGLTEFAPALIYRESNAIYVH